MKNALITGATKGIGRAIAFAFAKQGLNLAICSRHNEDLTEMKQKLLQLNPGILVFTHLTDCSIRQQLNAFASAAEHQLGFIDVLVNNVGIFEYSSILDDDDDAFNRQININLMPAYALYRYFGKTMMNARAGHIFNICSVASIQPTTTAGTYGVTKAAMYSLSNIMRLETQEHGVKVTAILPGSTLTESWAGTKFNPDRFVSANDVASAIISCYNMSSGANVDEIVIKPVLGQL